MLLLIALLATACLAENLPTYDPEYGVYIGDLSNLADGDIHGKVYVVNETAIQLINFTYSGKASGSFWIFINKKWNVFALIHKLFQQKN